MPKVSVIIPVYNVEKYLRECLDSVIHQTLHDIEIICVDDGATDRSFEILKEYEEKDARIQVIHQENGGLSVARNTGMGVAKGEYLYFLDSDDMIIEEALEELYHESKKNELDILYFDAKIFYENSDLWQKFSRFEEIGNRKKEYPSITSGADLFAQFVFNDDYSVSLCRQFIRNAFLKGIHLTFYPQILHEDNLFTFISILQAKRTKHVKKAYFLRRVRVNSIMTKPKSYKNFQGYFTVFVEMLKFCINHTFDGKATEAIKRQLDAILYASTNIYMELPQSMQCGITWTESEAYHFLFDKFINNKIQAQRMANMQQMVPRAELDAVHHSLSFRIGRMITYIPRKIRGGFRCYKEHGFIYTWNCILNKIYTVFKIEKKNFDVRESLADVSRNTINRPKDEDLDPSMYPEALKEWFLKRTGEVLNLDHPKTFNEKIQWLKLYDSTPLKTRLADKYLVRDWVKEKIGEKYLIPLLGVWDSFDEIDFGSLPEKFVLKTNHGSGWNILVPNKNELNIEDARKKFNKWMSTNYAFLGGFELQYKDIPRKIIAEKMLDSATDGINDYRFFCFDGEPQSIWVDFDSGKPTHRRNIYDLDWNLLPVHVNYPNFTDPVPCPKNLHKMIELSRILSKGFIHVRVDFYEVGDRVYFGEMTFTSQTGAGKWDPPEYNLKFGQMIHLPIDE